MTRGRLNRRVGLCAVLVAALVAGCGGGSSSSSQSHRAVNLSVLAPSDGSTVSVRSLEVVGSVSPHNAVVSVSGRPATVQSGVFHAPLTLSGPITHITVAATASGYTSSSTGITVHYTATGGTQDNASSGGASYIPPGGGKPSSGSGGSASGGAGIGQRLLRLLRLGRRLLRLGRRLLRLGRRLLRLGPGFGQPRRVIHKLGSRPLAGGPVCAGGPALRVSQPSGRSRASAHSGDPRQRHRHDGDAQHKARLGRAWCGR